MKITLDIDSILDQVYADSAIGAILKLRDPQIRTPLLTPDQRHGLRRMAAQAAGVLAGKAGFGISVSTPDPGDETTATITIAVPDGDSDSIEQQLSSAIALKTLSFTAASSGDHELAKRADTWALDALGQISDDRPFATRSSY